MADTKKEHYVPRCYLENFEGEKGKIQVFDKAILQIRPQTKENIAAENYFYDIDFDKMMDSGRNRIFDFCLFLSLRFDKLHGV